MNPLNLIRQPDSRAGRIFSLVIGLLILLTVIEVVIETLPGISPSLARVLELFEYIVVVAFTIEYGLRLAAAEQPLRYALSFLGIVDLLAILPFYLGLAVDLRAIRAFRLIRMLRVLKLAHYGDAAERLATAFREVRAEIVVFLFVAVIVLYLCGVGIYYCEHDAQPDRFSSVLDGLWWAVATLTTVGYGDLYPVTPIGRIFTFFVLIVGLGIVAVPTGLIASALTRGRAS